MSLTSLKTLLETGLEALFPEPDLPIQSIYLGRVMNYPEWSRLLAKAAAASPAWNSKRGKPTQKTESENHRVRQLLNGPAYPSFLKSLFADRGLTACIPYVEKVLVFEARDIFSDTARPDNLSRSARLPADAQVWLTLSPSPSDCTKP